MVINFNKKRRQISLILLLVLFFAGTIYWSNNYVENDAMKIVNNKSINNYIIDVVFDDKAKKIKCNQNITYVNNTGKTLDKIYMHIYPNAFSDKKICPFEKSEIEKAYPNGFDEGYIEIKNILNNGNKLEHNIKGEKNDILEIVLDKNLNDGEKYSIDIKYDVKIPNCLKAEVFLFFSNLSFSFFSL